MAENVNPISSKDVSIYNAIANAPSMRLKNKNANILGYQDDFFFLIS